jgi:hypothetical protein
MLPRLSLPSITRTTSPAATPVAVVATANQTSKSTAPVGVSSPSSHSRLNKNHPSPITNGRNDGRATEATIIINTTPTIPLIRSSSSSHVYCTTTGGGANSSMMMSQSQQHPPYHRRRRVSLDDEILRKNRKLIDNYLRKLGPHISSLSNSNSNSSSGSSSSSSRSTFHHSLTLNHDGVCCFPFGKFVIVLEVPEDHSQTCFIYTMVCHLNHRTDNVFAVMQHALQMNYQQQGTRGATIGLSDTEVNLCRTFAIAGMSASDMIQIVDEFILTAIDINRQLDMIKKSGMGNVPSSSSGMTAATISNTGPQITQQRRRDRSRTFSSPA